MAPRPQLGCLGLLFRRSGYTYNTQVQTPRLQQILLWSIQVFVELATARASATSQCCSVLRKRVAKVPKITISIT